MQVNQHLFSGGLEWKTDLKCMLPNKMGTLPSCRAWKNFQLVFRNVQKKIKMTIGNEYIIMIIAITSMFLRKY